MNQSHLERRLAYVRVIKAMADYYGRALSEDAMLMYLEDLQELSPDELSLACRQYRSNPENKFFPLPASLIAIVKGTQTPEDVGQDIATRIWEAMARHGWNNPDKARLYIGEAGWEVVKRFGGWLSLCEGTTMDSRGTLIAQMRGIATALHRKEVSVQRAALVGSDPLKKLDTPPPTNEAVAAMIPQIGKDLR
jgi:hypothetical protein